jgi:hypothetical protein
MYCEETTDVRNVPFGTTIEIYLPNDIDNFHHIYFRFRFEKLYELIASQRLFYFSETEQLASTRIAQNESKRKLERLPA